MKPEDQKRQTGRLKVRKEGQYRMPKSDWMNCELIDISTTGLALEGKQSFYIGDIIEIKFSLDKRLVVARLEITNLTGRKAGGKFMNLSEEDRSVIQELIHQNVIKSGVAQI